MVRAYFDDLNRTTSAMYGARFQVIDWENYSTAGAGRPQKLITEQTLERFRDSLGQLDPEAIERLVMTPWSGHVEALVRSLERHWHDHEEVRELMRGLAAAGSAAAFENLINRHFADAQTWTLVRSLGDTAVERIAASRSQPSGLRQLLVWERDHPEVWELVHRLAAAGSAPALGIQHDDTCQLVTRLEHRGDRDDTWELINKIADQGEENLRSRAAWWAWAHATAGPRAVAGLLAERGGMPTM